MFLTLTDFLAHFPPVKISRSDFAKKMIINYSKPLTLEEAFSLSPINGRKPIIKSTTDLRYVHRERVIDYFYDVVVVNRHKYLTCFYNSYFNFKDPSEMKWDVDVLKYDSSGKEMISMQRNDAARVLVRNLFYLELLHYTKVTNSVKSSVSFWQSLDNLYNKFILEDRFFAPSNIGLFLRDKDKTKGIVVGSKHINYNNLFYTFQQYQPKASILNPYTVHWIMQNKLLQPNSTGRIFTPVLSWGSYMMAFMESPEWSTYVGVDVMPSVCKKVEFLGEWYKKRIPQKKEIDIYCTPSEKLLANKDFMSKYTDYFDAVMMCPPYWNMEQYHEGEQSTEEYLDYQDWIDKYWEQTVKLCQLTLKSGGRFSFIINNYSDLKGNDYKLRDDLSEVAKRYFTEVEVIDMVNRLSPLRVNSKDRTEQLMIFKKK